MLTIDANVFVSASSPVDALNIDSDAFLLCIRQSGLQVYCPTRLLPEVASGIMRPTANINVALITIASVKTFPNINFVSLTERSADDAVRIALLCRLRGADAIYAAVAQSYGTTLVTWDQELLTRGPEVVPTMTPTDWLFAHPLQSEIFWIGTLAHGF
jgi:predicted nucleic acid-binding protein